jgi:hypothetical protein
MSGPESDSPIPGGLHQPKRNHYFDGKLLTAADLVQEQRYHIGQRQLLNWTLHGNGTVCGLQILAHPDIEKRNRAVVIAPGLALDCCGQEIVVAEPTVLEIADWIENDPALATRLNGDNDLCIALARRDQPAELVPVPVSGAGGQDGLEPNRVIEGFEVRLFAREPRTAGPLTDAPRSGRPGADDENPASIDTPGVSADPTESDGSIDRTVDGCVECGAGDGPEVMHHVVLAHIPGYVFADLPPICNAGEAREVEVELNNLAYRRLVPSNVALGQAVDGLLEQGAIEGPRGKPGRKGDRGKEGPKGARGERGPRGKRGRTGDPGPAGDRGKRGPQGKKGAAGEQGPRGERGRQGLPGPRGSKGDKGEPAAVINYNQIVALSWPHGHNVEDFGIGHADLFLRLGLVIGFRDAVDLRSIINEVHPGGSLFGKSHVFELLRSLTASPPGSNHPHRCWCVIEGARCEGLQTFNANEETGLIEEVSPLSARGRFGRAVRLTLDPAAFEGLNLQHGERLRVVLRGEFAVDERGRPVDASHLGGRLPTAGDTGGGQFESWLYV